MGKNANGNRKGKRGERRVASGYRLVGFDADREDAILECTSARTGRDVRVYDVNSITGEVIQLPLCIQVKEKANPSVWTAMSEARSDAGSEAAIAHVKRTQRAAFTPAERLVVMDEDFWWELLRVLRVKLGGRQLVTLLRFALKAMDKEAQDAG